MFGELIIWYLYLGGAGASMVALLSLADFLFRRDRRMGSHHFDWVRALGDKLFTRGFAVASVALMAGVLCLVADLGRPERFYYVFAFPTVSVLTFGSIVLGLTLLSAVFLFAIAAFKMATVPTWLVALAEVLGMVAGACTAVYTGVLLVQIESVELWNPVLPALFVCSALSVGTAALLCCLIPLEEIPEKTLHLATRPGAVFIGAEAACFVLYVIAALATDANQAFRFFFDEGLSVFWAGFVLCSLAVPVASAIVRRFAQSYAVVYLGLPFVLIGGFFLRYCVVNVPLA